MSVDFLIGALTMAILDIVVIAALFLPDEICCKRCKQKEDDNGLS